MYRNRLVLPWLVTHGEDSFRRFTLLGGTVFVKGAYEDPAFGRTCAVSGVCSLDDLKAVLSCPSEPFSDQSPNFRVWKLRLRGYHSWNEGAPLSTDERTDDLILGEDEVADLRRIVVLHERGWRPITTEGLHPSWSMDNAGQRRQSWHTGWDLPNGILRMRSLRYARFLIRTTDANGEPCDARLYAEGSHEIVSRVSEGKGINGGDAQVTHERWRTCRYFAPGRLYDDATIESLVGAYYPDASLYGERYGIRCFLGAMIVALAEGASVEWVHEDPDPRFVYISVMRPRSPRETMFELTFFEHGSQPPFTITVPGVELLARLAVVYHAGRENARRVQMPTPDIDLVLEPSTARSLYRLLTGEY